jgi:hypothetical protein
MMHHWKTNRRILKQYLRKLKNKFPELAVAFCSNGLSAKTNDNNVADGVGLEVLTAVVLGYNTV